MNTRVLVLHPKELEQDEVDGLTTRIAKHPHLPTHVKGELTVISARFEYMDFEKKHGKPVNWERWTNYLTGMREAFGTEPNFHALVVAPTSMVGRATADTVKLALKRGRTVVLRLTPDNTIVRVARVTVLDQQNFKRGWIVS